MWGVAVGTWVSCSTPSGDPEEHCSRISPTDDVGQRRQGSSMTVSAMAQYG
jgi:hypothetical protein